MIERSKLAAEMAQTYNQKRNVYSIDQILGHAKNDGKSYFLLLVLYTCIFWKIFLNALRGECFERFLNALLYILVL